MLEQSASECDGHLVCASSDALPLRGRVLCCSLRKHSRSVCGDAQQTNANSDQHLYLQLGNIRSSRKFYVSFLPSHLIQQVNLFEQTIRRTDKWQCCICADRCG